VKNLNYSKEKSFSANYSNSWEVDTTGKIMYLVQDFSSIFVKMPDGQFSNKISVNKNKVYTYNWNTHDCNVISKMAYWSGDQNIPDLA